MKMKDYYQRDFKNLFQFASLDICFTQDEGGTPSPTHDYRLQTAGVQPILWRLTQLAPMYRRFFYHGCVTDPDYVSGVVPTAGSLSISG